MAFEPSSGYVASNSLNDLNDASLPIFNVELVNLKFDRPSDFVAAEVANNVLILAFETGRILRFDLDSPEDIDDVDLPKRPSEIGVIRRMFLDPTASHLIITTTLAENYYLHTQSRQPKALSRLKGVPIESVSWNPSEPTASTREILIGASDGTVYEVYIEPSAEFYRREERYLKAVYKADAPVVGLWTDAIPGRPDVRRVLVATPSDMQHFVGKVGRHGREGSGSIYARLFESEVPTPYELNGGSRPGPSMLAVSPDTQEVASSTATENERAFAWLNSHGVVHGKLLTNADSSNLGNMVIQGSKMFPRSKIPPSQTAGGRPRAIQDPASSMILSHWHIIQLVEGRVVCTNRLNDTIVYDQAVLEPGETALDLVADQKKSTFWLFTKQEVFEISVYDESRDVWKILLNQQQFDAASQFAKTPSQKDAVATASGDYLVKKGQFLEAASVYGRSTKPFEQVALTFIDHGEQDALRKYLTTKLSTIKKSATMQRILLATWLVEIYISKLNALDDTIGTKAELSESMNARDTEDQLSLTRREFQDFVSKHKSDLDRKTVYEIISSHGREEELLYFATVVNDYNYVLAYWVQRERWTESLDVLKKQTDPEIFYKYSSVLMANVSVQFVEILMRQNQAVRYLHFEINQHHSTDAAVHNTLISIYASHPSRDESALLQYLEAQSYAQEQNYDADFALRLCIQHKRVQSCVHIYSSMSQYVQAVELALKYDEIDLASSVADRPESDPALRKKLWLAVAKKVISQSTGIKPAIEFLRRSDLLRIEDLIPFFPDFVVIDDFKEEICAALEEYSRQIDALKREMDESTQTAEHIKRDIKQLESRYAIVEPGEKCYICRLPLLARQFFVFPCQHAFHSECLGKKVVEQSGRSKANRISKLQTEVMKGVSTGASRERAARELDELVAAACILCSELAVKQIDEPFVPMNETNEWAL
ncbi:Vacuolar protein sorting-associated protein 18-like protein [Lasiodiplodia hormozganensis]|uniref:Vacuolar protein sorting-associated protein 18-like protein n=1 Tax=Lasiodiplodia hormozganensis TaxID=869390 RepID=A0AA39YVI0_9PEZI|nr:Vacuolar protein sorting-associated protein 18-like protein [Lasiodiplodia hormozganensis]